MTERKYRTKSGKVLTDEDIQKLSDEAEKGYEVRKGVEIKGGTQASARPRILDSKPKKND